MQAQGSPAPAQLSASWSGGSKGRLCNVLERCDPRVKQSETGEKNAKTTKLIENILANHQVSPDPSFESENRYQALAEHESESDAPLADPSWTRRSRERVFKFMSCQCMCNSDDSQGQVPSSPPWEPPEEEAIKE